MSRQNQQFQTTLSISGKSPKFCLHCGIEAAFSPGPVSWQAMGFAVEPSWSLQFEETHPSLHSGGCTGTTNSEKCEQGCQGSKGINKRIQQGCSFWAMNTRCSKRRTLGLQMLLPVMIFHYTALRTGQILLTLILWWETITDSREKGMVCSAFLMGTSFGWVTLSCSWRIWKAMLWMCWVPGRVERGSSFWKLGSSFPPSSNGWLTFHLVFKEYFCICFFKSKTTKVLKYFYLISKSHVLLNLLLQLVPKT